ncbi:MAG: cation transporter [Thermodesulfobacteriota bacterium]|nr:cation transporter [Thermodesulfobacteriota bacterium]
MQPQKKNNSIFVSMICNLLLVFFKGATGILANSSALVADALHSMTDVIAFFINYRACKESESCFIADKTGTDEKTQKRVAEIEVKATYCTGIFLLTVGLSIYFYNTMVILLGRMGQPEPITLVVAVVVWVIYLGLYLYLERNGNKTEPHCAMTNRNSDWQNKFNVISGAAVVIGLTGSMFGFIFMDELAAVVVGSILTAIGIRWIAETKTMVGPWIKHHYNSIIAASVSASWVITAILLSIQL